MFERLETYDVPSLADISADSEVRDALKTSSRVPALGALGKLQLQRPDSAEAL